MAKFHQDIPCRKYPQTSVHITWSIHKTKEKVTLRAYAIDSRTGVRRDYSREIKRNAKSEADVQTKISALYHSVCANIELHERKSSASVSNIRNNDTISPFREAFEYIKASEDPVCANWGKQHTRHCMTYFENNVLPVLDPAEQMPYQYMAPILSILQSLV